MPSTFKHAGIQVCNISYLLLGSLLESPSTYVTRATNLSIVADFAADDADVPWKQVGEVTVTSDQPDAGPAINIQRVKAYSSRLEYGGEIRTGPIKRVLTFTSVIQNELTVQLAALSGPIASTSTAGDRAEYTPFANGGAPVYGWFRIGWIDQVDQMLRVEIHWGELRMGQPLSTGPGAQVTPQFVLTLIPDPNTKGDLLELAA